MTRILAIRVVKQTNERTRASPVRSLRSRKIENVSKKVRLLEKNQRRLF
jgi:hypothetical protein